MGVAAEWSGISVNAQSSAADSAPWAPVILIRRRFVWIAAAACVQWWQMPRWNGGTVYDAAAPERLKIPVAYELCI